ncbi:hypothetical protein G5I_03558 [Acromyrmex echinatior]|uniref:Uncharacterized protein n=1 Tax=Acromyrmex echinatior TaxID=103372 RepID=F4WDA5_ACREC|nr:hypothetical protein G5I_03558 [Acromyrmex echinatior]
MGEFKMAKRLGTAAYRAVEYWLDLSNQLCSFRDTCRRAISLEFPCIRIFIARQSGFFPAFVCSVIASIVDRCGVRFVTLHKAVVWSNKRAIPLRAYHTTAGWQSSSEIIWRAHSGRQFAHWMHCARSIRKRIVIPSGKGITQHDEIIAKRSIVDALFETIIVLGWTRFDYWWRGQFHFARIIAQPMCLAVPRFRVIRVETDRTIPLAQLPLDINLKSSLVLDHDETFGNTQLSRDSSDMQESENFIFKAVEFDYVASPRESKLACSHI